ncbi:MAG: hypothetical protein CVU05_14715 [Bacteroidetes bacterium HGW-Bacteroidetes-21]|jgi:hypothetical protein|nr:MAG: hypothetical protein CVU05_14715 [Bacteroidetes bacterium HGW-Bacteroidetes-21]
MKKEEIKYHKEALVIIDNFKRPKTGKLISRSIIFNGKETKFKPYKKEFQIVFQYDFAHMTQIDVGQYRKGINIQFEESKFCLENTFFGSHSPPTLTGNVDKIHTKGYSEKRKYYYQLIIPLEKELRFHYNIEQSVFITDLGYRSRNGTVVLMNNEQIQVCCIKNEKKEYFLTIDSPIKQTFTEFADKANAIKIGMGYLSGYYAGNQGYYFAYTNKNKKNPKQFRFVALRDSIKSIYSPVYSNAYGYLHGNPLSKKYYPLLRPVSKKEFSVLCEKIYKSLEFSSMIMLMLESSVASLLFMPGGYSIALETLSDIVIGKRKLKLSPIKDKSISRKIRKEILEVIEKYSTYLSSGNIETLKKRIDQLNQITNMARLKAPFDLLGIRLLDEDLKILETRNDFLHGRVPDLTSSGENRSIERINKDLYYCSIRLYTLLNMLILKCIGYDNRVVNLPKIHEVFTEISVDEEPFRQV